MKAFSKLLREYWIDIIIIAVVGTAFWMVGSIAFYLMSLFFLIAPEIKP